MTGWLVIISRQTQQVDGSPEIKEVLARWETQIGGIDWLDQLCKAGEAVLVAYNSGYPLLYSAKAEHILPFISNGSPNYYNYLTQREGFVSFVEFDNQKIHERPKDQTLTIAAWDLS